MKQHRSVLAGRLAQAALFAIVLGAAGVQTAATYAPDRLPNALTAAIRGVSNRSSGSSFHDPQQPEPRLERTRSTAAQPFAAGLPARRSVRSPLSAQPLRSAAYQPGCLAAGLFDATLARAPPSLLS